MNRSILLLTQNQILKNTTDKFEFKVKQNCLLSLMGTQTLIKNIIDWWPNLFDQ